MIKPLTNKGQLTWPLILTLNTNNCKTKDIVLFDDSAGTDTKNYDITVFNPAKYETLSYFKLIDDVFENPLKVGMIGIASTGSFKDNPIIVEFKDLNGDKSRYTSIYFQEYSAPIGRFYFGIDGEFLFNGAQRLTLGCNRSAHKELKIFLYMIEGENDFWLLKNELVQSA